MGGGGGREREKDRQADTDRQTGSMRQANPVGVNAKVLKPGQGTVFHEAACAFSIERALSLR